MTLPPKLSGFEHTCLLVAAVALGSQIATSTHLWIVGLIGGVGAAVASFVLRKGWTT